MTTVLSNTNGSNISEDHQYGRNLFIVSGHSLSTGKLILQSATKQLCIFARMVEFKWDDTSSPSKHYDF